MPKKKAGLKSSLKLKPRPLPPSKSLTSPPPTSKSLTSTLTTPQIITLLSTDPTLTNLLSTGVTKLLKGRPNVTDADRSRTIELLIDAVLMHTGVIDILEERFRSLVDDNTSDDNNDNNNDTDNNDTDNYGDSARKTATNAPSSSSMYDKFASSILDSPPLNPPSPTRANITTTDIYDDAAHFHINTNRSSSSLASHSNYSSSPRPVLPASPMINKNRKQRSAGSSRSSSTRSSFNDIDVNIDDGEVMNGLDYLGLSNDVGEFGSEEDSDDDDSDDSDEDEKGDDRDEDEIEIQSNSSSSSVEKTTTTTCTPPPRSPPSKHSAGSLPPPSPKFPTSSSSSSSHHTVHFSALNPNPTLVLDVIDSNGTEGGEQGLAVSFNEVCLVVGSEIISVQDDEEVENDDNNDDDDKDVINSDDGASESSSVEANGETTVVDSEMHFDSLLLNAYTNYTEDDVKKITSAIEIDNDDNDNDESDDDDDDDDGGDNMNEISILPISERLRIALLPLSSTSPSYLQTEILNEIEIDANGCVNGHFLTTALSNVCPDFCMEDNSEGYEELGNELVKMLDVGGDGRVSLKEFYGFMGWEGEDFITEDDVSIQSESGSESGNDEEVEVESIENKFKTIMATASEQNLDLTSDLSSLDIIGSGKIPSSDLYSLLRTNALFTEAFDDVEIKTIVAMFDPANDGLVSLSEWYTAAGLVFDRDDCSLKLFSALVNSNGDIKAVLDEQCKMKSLITLNDFERISRSINSEITSLLIAKVFGIIESDGEMNVEDLYSFFNVDFAVILIPGVIDPAVDASAADTSVSSRDMSSLPPTPTPKPVVKENKIGVEDEVESADSSFEEEDFIEEMFSESDGSGSKGEPDDDNATVPKIEVAALVIEPAISSESPMNESQASVSFNESFDGSSVGESSPVRVSKGSPKKTSPKRSPKKENPKKESPKRGTPAKESLKTKQESPKKVSPKKESPKKESPRKESPKIGSPKKESPKKESPKKESPKKQSPKKESPTKSISPQPTTTPKLNASIDSTDQNYGEEDDFEEDFEEDFEDDDVESLPTKVLSPPTPPSPGLPPTIPSSAPVDETVDDYSEDEIEDDDQYGEDDDFEFDQEEDSENNQPQPSSSSSSLSLSQLPGLKGMPPINTTLAPLPGIGAPITHRGNNQTGPTNVNVNSSLRRPKTSGSKTGVDGFGLKVKFYQPLVTDTHTRPRTAVGDVEILFYTEKEISGFEDAAYEEESRGLEIGGLDGGDGYDDNDELEGLDGSPKSNVEKKVAGGTSNYAVEHDVSVDMIETFEDYVDESFDKGGFGEESDGF